MLAGSIAFVFQAAHVDVLLGGIRCRENYCSQSWYIPGVTTVYLTALTQRVFQFHSCSKLCRLDEHAKSMMSYLFFAYHKILTERMLTRLEQMHFVHLLPGFPEGTLIA